MELLNCEVATAIPVWATRPKDLGRISTPGRRPAQAPVTQTLKPLPASSVPTNDAGTEPKRPQTSSQRHPTNPINVACATKKNR
jgi:hypothetical protein